MNNKGQDLSLTTIILAALGLIILVVLAAVFTGRIGGFGQGLGQIQENVQCSSSCKNMGQGYTGGQFRAQCDTTQWENNQVRHPSDDTQKCCCDKPATTAQAPTAQAPTGGG